MAGDPVGPGNHYYSWTSATNASEENNSRRMIDPFFPVMFMNDIYSFFKINPPEDSTISISKYIINYSILLDTYSLFNELHYYNIEERIIRIVKKTEHKKIIYEAIMDEIKSIKEYSEFSKDLIRKEYYRLTINNIQKRILGILNSKYAFIFSKIIIEILKPSNESLNNDNIKELIIDILEKTDNRKIIVDAINNYIGKLIIF